MAATSIPNVDQSTPEYLVLQKSYTKLVAHIKFQPRDICSALFEKGHIPSTVQDYVTTLGIPDSMKADKIISSLMAKVELDQSVYHSFMNILKSEGPSADTIVKQLEEAFKAEQADSDCSSEDSFHSLSDSDTPIRSPSITFICPFCKGCTVETFFSKNGCPSAKKNEQDPLFPYLDLSALSESERLLLKGKLKDETIKMMYLFADTEDSVLVSLEKQNIGVARLRNYAENLVTKIGKEEEIERLRKSESVADVFCALQPFKSFFHYEVIERITQKFGSEKDNELMKDYISKFKQFCERSVFEVPPNIFHGTAPRPDDKVFSMVFTSKKEYTSLGDIADVRRKLANILNIDILALQLCSITNGSVYLRFSVSSQVAEQIFPLSQPQLTALGNIHLKVPQATENEDLLKQSEGYPKADCSTAPLTETVQVLAPSHLKQQNEQLLDPISKDPSKVVKQQVLLIAFEVVCGSTIFIIQVNAGDSKEVFLYNTGPKIETACKNLLGVLEKLCPKNDSRYKLNVIVPNSLPESYGGLGYLLENQLLDSNSQIVTTSDFNDSEVLLHLLCTNEQFDKFWFDNVKLHFKENSHGKLFTVQHSEKTLFKSNKSSQGCHQDRSLINESITLQIADSKGSTNSCVLATYASSSSFSWLFSAEKKIWLSIFHIPCNMHEPRLQRKVINSLPTEEEITEGAQIFALYSQREYISEYYRSQLLRGYASIKHAIEQLLELPPKSYSTHSVLCTILKSLDQLPTKIERSLYRQPGMQAKLEEMQEMEKAELNFTKHVLMWANFYYPLAAGLYTMPTFNDCVLMIEVLCGISLACMWRKMPCHILLTSRIELQTHKIPSIVIDVLAKSKTKVWCLDTETWLGLNPTYCRIDPYQRTHTTLGNCEIAVNPSTHHAEAGGGFLTLCIKDFVVAESICKKNKVASAIGDKIALVQAVQKFKEECGHNSISDNPCQEEKNTESKVSDVTSSYDPATSSTTTTSIQQEEDHAISGQQSSSDKDALQEVTKSIDAKRYPDVIQGTESTVKSKTSNLQKPSVASSEKEKEAKEIEKKLILKTPPEPESTTLSPKEFLTAIFYSGANKETPTLLDILICLLSPLVTSQIERHLESEQSKLASVLKPVLKAEVDIDSSTIVYSAAKMAAVSAKIKLLVPETMLALIVNVRNPRTKQVEASINVVPTHDNSSVTEESIEIPNHLLMDGCCGQTPAYLLFCQSNPHWQQAVDYTVEDVLNLLPQKMRNLIKQNLPDFLFSLVQDWKIVHYLTTLSIEEEESHIYASPSTNNELSSHEIPVIKLGMVSFHVQQETLIFDCECEVGGIKGHLQFTNHLEELTINVNVSPTQLLTLTGVTINEFAFPWLNEGWKQESQCTAIITLSLASDMKLAIKSVSMLAITSADLLCMWLPESMVEKVDRLEVFALIQAPFSEDRKTGIRAHFILKFTGCTLKCVLKVIPLEPDAVEYLYQIELLTVSCQMTNDDAHSASVLDELSKFDCPGLQPFDEIFKLGETFLEALTIHRVMLTMSSGITVQKACFQASLSDFELLKEITKITSAELEGNFQENRLLLKCIGNFILLNKFCISTELTLPTKQTAGRLHFINSDLSLTLLILLEGLELLPPDFKENSLLDQLLDISLNEVEITLTLQNKSIHVSNVRIELYKENVHLRVLEISQVEVTMTAEKTKNSYMLEIKGDCIVARNQNGHFSFSSASREVELTYNCDSPISLQNLPFIVNDSDKCGLSQYLDNISIKTVTLILTIGLELKEASFEASLSYLSLFSEKVIITESEVAGRYMNNVLALQFFGNLKLFHKFLTTTELCLPNSQEVGKFYFRSEDQSLTLLTVLDGLEILPDNFMSISILKELLAIHLKEVDVKLVWFDDSIYITRATINLFLDHLDLSPVKVNDIDLSISVNKIDMSESFTVEFEGDCRVGQQNWCGHVSFSSVTDEILVSLNCPSPQSLCDLVRSKYRAQDQTFPMIGAHLDSNLIRTVGGIRAGFVFSLNRVSAASSITSLSFAIVAENELLNEWLPKSLVEIVDQFDVFAVIQSPFNEDRKTGIRAQFILKFSICTLKCVLKVIPPKPDATEYLYEIDMLPVFFAVVRANSASVLSTLLSFNCTGLEQLRNFLGDFEHFLDALTIYRVTLTLSSDIKVKRATFDASLSNVNLPGSKIEIVSSKLECSYKENELFLKCTGNLILLNKFYISTELTLPTLQTAGRVHFINSDRLLTLLILLEAYKLLPSDLKENSLLHQLLDISLKEVEITLTLQNKSINVSKVRVELYKENVYMSVVDISQANVIITAEKTENTYNLEIEGNCIVNRNGIGHFSFSSATREVELTYNCDSPISLQNLPFTVNDSDKCGLSQYLDNISIKTVSLILTIGLELKEASFEASLSYLSLFSEKVIITESEVAGRYMSSVLALQFSGKLQLFYKFLTTTELCLPNSQEVGKFYFRNEDQSLTLLTLLKEFEILPDDFMLFPILNQLLVIGLKEVDVKVVWFNDSIYISRVTINLFLYNLDLLPVKIGDIDLFISVNKIDMSESFTVDFEGDCKVGQQNWCGHISFSSITNEFFVSLNCPSPQSLCDLVRSKYRAQDETFPMIGAHLDSNLIRTVGGIRAGFVFSLNRISAASSITSLSFAIVAGNEILNKWLPESMVEIIDKLEEFAVIQSPFSEERKTGIYARFVLQFPICTLKCVLKVIPAEPDATEYFYQIDLLPVFYPSTGEPINTVSVLNEIFESIGLQSLQSMSDQHELGDALLRALTVNRVIIVMSSLVKIKDVILSASLSGLSLSNGNVVVADSSVEAVYKENILSIKCCGNLILLKQFTSVCEFNITTLDEKGNLYFPNYNPNLNLKEIISGFKVVSKEITSHPIVSEFIKNCVKEVNVSICKSGTDQFHVDNITVRIYKKELDISIVKFFEVELCLTVNKEKGTFNFQLQGYISNWLYALLDYDPGSHKLSGNIHIDVCSTVKATDALKAFDVEAVGSSVDNYQDLTGVIQNHFMKVFNAESSSPGLTSTIGVTIQVPKKLSRFEKYSLSHICVRVKDIIPLGNFVFKYFSFEYSRTPKSGRIKSTVDIKATVVMISERSHESAMLEFSLHHKRSESSILTAKFCASPKRGFVKLSSLLELAGCGEPSLPAIEIPSIFDADLLDGSMISFNFSPFRIHAFDVKVKISEWQVFDEPRIILHDLLFVLKWTKAKEGFNLSFTGNLRFLKLNLCLNGIIHPKEVCVLCEQLPKDFTLNFQEVLDEYTQNSQDKFDIPQNIGLPDVIVNLKEIKLTLKDQYKTFYFNGQINTDSYWQLAFGLNTIKVSHLGGVLEWSKSSDQPPKYKAYIYGTLMLLKTKVDIQMQLGKGSDIIVAGLAYNPKYIEYEAFAGYLTSSSGDSTAATCRKCKFSELAPTGISQIHSVKSSVAFNITRNQFFMSGLIDNIGSTSLFIGQLPNNDHLDYLLQISTQEGFTFSTLSDQLSFVDEAIIVRNACLIVSNFSSTKLSNILQPYKDIYSHLFTYTNFSFNKPLDSVISGLCDEKLLVSNVNRGTTLYAEIDFQASEKNDSLINNVTRISHDLKQPDIIVTAFITEVCSSDSQSISISDQISADSIYLEVCRNIELKAWIADITLIGFLTLSDVELNFQLPENILQLKGCVSIAWGTHSLIFHGSLCFTRLEATFKVSLDKPCRNEITKPVGMAVTVRDLQLKLKYNLTCDSVQPPVVKIKGEVNFAGVVTLKAYLLLVGVSFKVFYISLKNGLSFSLFFETSCIDWKIPSLHISIESGEFYYAEAEFQHKQKIFKEGFNMEAVICLMNSSFKVTVEVSKDRKNLRMFGTSIKPINFGFARFTSENFTTGPELKYYSSEDKEPRLSLEGGLELLGWKALLGSISYLPKSSAFEGEIKYQGRFLWFKNPALKVRWSEKDRLEVVEFKIDGGSRFDMLNAVQTFAKALFKLITGIFGWNMKFNLTTTENTNSEKYLVKFQLTGFIEVKVRGYFDFDCIPLPIIPINILKKKDFEFSQLPTYLLQCLWGSADELCDRLLEYLNPIELAKRLGKTINESINGILEKMNDLTCKVVDNEQSVWNFFFGGSTFIMDENNNVVGYVDAGKNGKPLKNEEYIVKLFGPFLVVAGIGEMVADLSRTGKTCLAISKNMNLSQDYTLNQETLSMLHKASSDVSQQLILSAHKILSVSNLAIEMNTVTQKAELQISWKVGTQDSNFVYDEDEGDIEYHVKVSVTVIEVVSSIRDIPDLKTVKVLDQFLTRPKNLKEQSLWPFCTTNIKEFLSKTISIGVSIVPSVTMQVKAIPTDAKPIHVEQEWINSKSLDWMEDARTRIEEEGRKKEVTMIGKLQYKELHLNPSDKRDIIVTTTSFNAYECTISGKILATCHSSWYAVELVDVNNRTIVLARKVIKSQPGESRFDIDLPELTDLSQKEFELSEGPYVINCISIDDNYKTQCYEDSSGKCLERHQPPTQLTQVFPDPDKYHIDDKVKVTWLLSESDKSQIGGYMFYLIGSQTTTSVNVNENEEQSIEMSTLMLLPGVYVSPTEVESGFSTVCEYEFSLVEILRKDEIDRSKPLNLHCSVCKASDKERLPSLPVNTSEITVITPPTKFTCTMLETDGALLASWSRTSNSLSYRLEFFDSETALTIDYQFKKKSESIIEGCDVDHIIYMNKLKQLKYNGGAGYSLRINAIGDGSEILRSPFPKQDTHKFYIIPVNLLYNERTDSIVLSFKLPNNSLLLQFHVQLTQCSEHFRRKLGEDIVQPPHYSTIFTPEQWKSNSHQNCPSSQSYKLFGWVTALTNGKTDDYWFGCSQELSVLPSPKEFTVETTFNHELGIDSWNLRWKGEGYSFSYQYGLYRVDLKASLVVSTTRNRTGTILETPKVDSPPYGINIVKVFVQSIIQSDENTTIPSHKLFSSDSYYLVHSIHTSSPLYLSSVSLYHLNTTYITGIIFQPSAFSKKPIQLKYMVMQPTMTVGKRPHMLLVPSSTKPFPNISYEKICGFWFDKTEEDRRGKDWKISYSMPTNGYLYCYDILEKLQKEQIAFGSGLFSKNKDTIKADGNLLLRCCPVPLPWYNKIHVLFYCKCSELKSTEKEGYLKVVLTVKAKRNVDPTNKGTSASKRKLSTEKLDTSQQQTVSTAGDRLNTAESSVDNIPSESETHSMSHDQDKFEDSFIKKDQSTCKSEGVSKEKAQPQVLRKFEDNFAAMGDDSLLPQEKSTAVGAINSSTTRGTQKTPSSKQVPIKQSADPLVIIDQPTTKLKTDVNTQSAKQPGILAKASAAIKTAAKVLPKIISTKPKQQEKVFKKERTIVLTRHTKSDKPTGKIFMWISAVQFEDLKDCSIVIDLNGKNCEIDDFSLYVTYS